VDAQITGVELRRNLGAQAQAIIELEHTRKNKMILAVKRCAPPAAAAALAQVAELRRYFGIREQALETLLQAGGLGTAA
jgi:hypothetical protein